MKIADPVRSGLSTKTAFLSGLKQNWKFIEVIGASTGITTESDEPVIDCSESEHIRRRSLFKTFLRPVVGYIYRRILKPALRPAAFRVRRYLINGFIQEFQKSSADTLSNLQQLSSVLWNRLDILEQYSAATARRVAINCGSGEVLVRTEVGFIICPASDHALLSCLLDTGELERGTRVLIQRYLKPGDVYVDVGANIGMHTLAAARAMHGKGKIIAFEPFEQTMRMLEKSVWMNGFSNMTEIHHAAVSNSSGCQRLFLGATSGHHSLFVLETSPTNTQGPVEVPVVRLDGVIASGQRIDLMKIDVEGAELDVLDGGTSLISGNPEIALIVEFGPAHLRRTGQSPGQWLNSFRQIGLDYRVINNESGALEEWSLDALEKVESANIFFAFPKSSAWNRLI